jgi:outer membrane murein-binding lipoprotein Lpp
MRIRSMFLASTALAVGMVLVLTGFAAVLVMENRELRSDLRSLRAELDQVRAEGRQWTEAREAASADLATARERVEELSKEVALLKEEGEKQSEAVTVRLPLQSHRVRAYLGNQQVGMGWLVPHQFRTNAVDGQVGYEPVIVLDESVREKVGVTQTNVVERDVSRATTVNYNYQPAYASSWPIYRVRPGGPGKGPAQPPASTPPEPPPAVQSPFLSTQIWHPQNPPGRPGGDWISSGTRSGRGLTPPANPARSSPFPARY